MTVNIIKPRCLAAIILGVLLAAPSYAETFKEMFMREVTPFVRNGGAVVILFTSDRPMPGVLATIAAAAKSTNPNAVINKQWVSDVVFRGHNDEKKCGLIIGKWAPGALPSEWEPVVLRKISNHVNSVTFQYARGGTLKTLVGTEASEGDDLMEICL